jgi:hypothetical protein
MRRGMTYALLLYLNIIVIAYLLTLFVLYFQRFRTALRFLLHLCDVLIKDSIAVSRE